MQADLGPDSEVLSEGRFGEVDLSTFISLLSAATEMTTLTDDVLRDAEAGISVKEWDVLAFVHSMGPTRPSQVLRRVALTSRPQTLSSMLARLERRGLVTRTAHPDDPRGVLVESTDAGAAIVEKVFPLIARRIVRPFAGHYSDGELKTLGALLSRLVDRRALAP